MEEQLITYETAKLAKEKGFDVESNGHAYFNVEGHIIEGHLAFAGEYENLGYAPRQAFLQKWLRETHNLHVGVLQSDGWECDIYHTKNGFISHASNCVDTYEEALEKGLQSALRLII